jgi:hypothetical protein
MKRYFHIKEIDDIVFILFKWEILNNYFVNFTILLNELFEYLIFIIEIIFISVINFLTFKINKLYFEFWKWDFRIVLRLLNINFI